MGFIRRRMNVAAACAKCETLDCLTRCQYMDLGLEEARVERQRILDGEDSRVLRECATCYACEEYCPYENHPFYLIVERQEMREQLSRVLGYTLPKSENSDAA